MKRIITTLAILWLIPCAMAQYTEQSKRDPLKLPYRISQVALIGATSMDFYSGRRLDQNRFHEANVMGNKASVQALFQFGTTAGILALTHVGFKKGSRKAAIIANLAAAGVHGWAAAHNWKLK